MPINQEKVGTQIAALRKRKELTQAELGERLSVSFQAVSKWERGETLPDTAILSALARALDSTIDNILNGGERAVGFKGKKTMQSMRDGVDCLERVGKLLGRDNAIYEKLINGLSREMNTDIAAMLADDSLREGLVVEAAIACLMDGYCFDIAEAKRVLKNPHWYNTFCEFAAKFGVV